MEEENFKLIDGGLYEKVIDPQEYIKSLSTKLANALERIKVTQEQIESSAAILEKLEVQKIDLEKKIEALTLAAPKDTPSV